MRTIRHWHGLDAADRGASAAMGNFDGVHRGHSAVIDSARRPGMALGVVTFEPHPREYFQPEAPPFRLMGPRTRAHRLEKQGVATLFELPFDRTLAELEPDGFVDAVLHNGLGLGHVAVGADFRFGRGRSGTAGDLAALCERRGIGVTVVDLVSNAGQEISSTAIRNALAEGRPRDAAAMLGHWHRIEGPVLHGDRRGRTLGYPTANMALDRLHLPRLGVYAVRCDVLTGPHRGRHDAVASLGVRPMFGDNRPNIETHLFDFAGDLYGAELSVALIDYLRPELRFSGLPELVAQMDRDSAAARGILAKL
jgi:riboflavin kinase/FMN adenylyltransferase